MSDPRVALLFLIPGVSETFRVIGRATISTDPELCASFAMQGKTPRCVLVIAVEQVFFQCAKAIVRSKLWDPSIQVERASLPTAGKILAEITRRQARRRGARPPRAGADEGRRSIDAAAAGHAESARRSALSIPRSTRTPSAAPACAAAPARSTLIGGLFL